MWSYWVIDQITDRNWHTLFLWSSQWKTIEVPAPSWPRCISDAGCGMLVGSFFFVCLCFIFPFLPFPSHVYFLCYFHTHQIFLFMCDNWSCNIGWMCLTLARVLRSPSDVYMPVHPMCNNHCIAFDVSPPVWLSLRRMAFHHPLPFYTKTTSHDNIENKLSFLFVKKSVVFWIQVQSFCRRWLWELTPPSCIQNFEALPDLASKLKVRFKPQIWNFNAGIWINMLIYYMAIATVTTCHLPPPKTWTLSPPAPYFWALLTVTIHCTAPYGTGGWPKRL